MRTLRMAILGRQGSGKGTQSARIVEHYGCKHLSTGDVLRAAVAAGTELGQEAKAVMESGGLVGDSIMNGIVAERLATPEIIASGVLLDGYPRTADQADALEKMLESNGQSLTVAINLDVPLEVVTARMVARGREDDTPEAIQRRLDLYEEQTEPLIDWFDTRGLLDVVDGQGPEDEVLERVIAAIDKRLDQQ